MIDAIRRLLGMPRRLTPRELNEIQELTRIAGAERFKAHYYAENTAILNVEGSKGKVLAAQQEKIAAIVEQVKSNHVNAKLAELGYQRDERVTIDLTTGKITKLREETKNGIMEANGTQTNPRT